MLSAMQKAAIGEILHTLITTTGPPRKHQLSEMFMDLVSRSDWPEYYELIPEPRCLNGIKTSLEKNRYRDAADAYTDLSLIFWNAMFYNEPKSQIATDAEKLKSILETEWKKRSVLPSTRSSPPPSSAQKVHAPLPPEPKPNPAPTLTLAPPKPSTPRRTATPTRTATPLASASTQPTPAPVAASAPPPPPQPARSPSPDAEASEPEVDVEGESGAPEARDGEGEAIVRYLERGLPRWKGFVDVGWMEDVSPERLIEIVHAVKSYKDVIGNRLSMALEAPPEEPVMQNASCTYPLSLKIIETNVRAKSYSSAKAFDMDMARLFEKARRWHDPGTEPYGHTLFLQRFYQALTSRNPPPGPSYASTTNFASLTKGPGAPHLEGVTTFRVPTRGRTFVDEVVYKGWRVRLGDWVHLANADAPGRPIVAQVFKVWVGDEVGRNQGVPGMTVCWYYRPEETVHPAHRVFWENEIFKTSHFADHPLPDLLERIAVQFTARHIRGRPRPPAWHPGWPLYVCDSRYNDRYREFVRIKNWASCVPEEVRARDWMPVYPFERTVFPRRFSSPFLGPNGGKARGPGAIGSGDIAGLSSGAGGDVKEGDGRKKGKKAGVDEFGPSKGLYVGSASAAPPPAVVRPPPPETTHVDAEDRSIATAAGGLANLGGAASVEKLPAETTKWFDRDPETGEMLWFAGAPVDAARPPALRHSLAYLHFVAMKRKKGLSTHTDEGGDAMDVDGEEGGRAKRVKTVTEVLREGMVGVFGSDA